MRKAIGKDHDPATEFPIPMRGNETYMQATTPVIYDVSDPHEG